MPIPSIWVWYQRYSDSCYENDITAGNQFSLWLREFFAIHHKAQILYLVIKPIFYIHLLMQNPNYCDRIIDDLVEYQVRFPFGCSMTLTNMLLWFASVRVLTDVVDFINYQIVISIRWWYWPFFSGIQPYGFWVSNSLWLITNSNGFTNTYCVTFLNEP